MVDSVTNTSPGNDRPTARPSAGVQLISTLHRQANGQRDRGTAGLGVIFDQVTHYLSGPSKTIAERLPSSNNGHRTRLNAIPPTPEVKEFDWIGDVAQL